MIQYTNDHLRVTNRTGGAVIDALFSDFFALPTDPVTGNGGAQVIFDAAAGRWIAAEASWDCYQPPGGFYGWGYLDFAVSDSADPTKGWTIYAIGPIEGYAPFPSIANSTTLVGMSLGMRSVPCGPSFSISQTRAMFMDWSSVKSAPDQLPFKLFHNENTIWVGVHSSPASKAEAYFVGTGGGDTHFRKVTGLVSTKTGSTITFEDVNLSGAGIMEAIPTNNVGGAEQQDGDPVEVDIPRITSATWHERRLAVVSSRQCSPEGLPCARVTELSTATATPAVSQDFVVHIPGASVYSAAAAFDGQGGLHVAWNQSTSTSYIDAYAAHQVPTDPVNTVGTPELLRSGTAKYNWVWGPTQAIDADPLGPAAVWTAAPVAGPSETYEARVKQLDRASGDTYNPIPPVRILDTRLGTGLSGVFQNSVPRTFNVAGAGGGAIPSDAVAITANLTVVDQQGAGYVSVGPSISATPATSTINFPFGDTRANNLTLPLNGDGDLQAVYKGPPAKFTHLLLDVTGYFTADDAGATYQPITAVRKLDSRLGTGLSGKFNANTPRSFQVTGGTVPAEAVAVTGNLTVVGQSKAGYVSLTPASTANPTTSTINFPLGDTRANGVTVPLSGAGKLWAVFKASGGSTDLIFDVTGYYLEGTSGLRFYPLNPGRIMDTRFNTLTQLFGQFTSSVPRTLVTGGHFGVPGNALAVTGNLTAVGQTRAGYVSITKDPTANPAVSTLNFPLGDVRANGATVPLNAANDLAIVYKATTGAKTHLILDVTGYFR